jgi:hypothetical protein
MDDRMCSESNDIPQACSTGVGILSVAGSKKRGRRNFPFESRRFIHDATIISRSLGGLEQRKRALAHTAPSVPHFSLTGAQVVTLRTSIQFATNLFEDSLTARLHWEWVQSSRRSLGA